MSEPETFDRIVAVLREMTLDQSQWPKANALIHDILGTCGSTMMLARDPPKKILRTLSDGPLFHNNDLCIEQELHKETGRTFCSSTRARGSCSPKTVPETCSRSAACWRGAASCSPAPRTTTTSCRDPQPGPAAVRRVGGWRLDVGEMLGRPAASGAAHHLDGRWRAVSGGSELSR